ncbi:MAG: aminopeptidase P family protein, partial [Chloroflexi bacterium]|nr:aminopeptidase P family protein [Chloroflexota bacterium]
MNQRLDMLRRELELKELDAILISQAENRRYLSGFTGSTGHLLISPSRAILATDFRYTEQAENEAHNFEVVRIEGELSQWFPTVASLFEAKRWGFEAQDLIYSLYQQLLMALDKSAELKPTEGLVEGLRAVKEKEELKCIERAAAITDAAYEHILATIHPGMTERALAWELEKYIRERGSEGVAFDLIVASGPNAALPHAQPTERAVQAGEPIIFDVGSKAQGYHSDMTRTLCLGTPDATFAKVYDIVLKAQAKAIDSVISNITGEQAHNLALAVIQEAGYGDAFGHGLGHGVGLAIHELPRLGKNSSHLLSEGMVFTIEPGIYISGWGGVRIEDMVVLQQ